MYTYEVCAQVCSWIVHNKLANIAYTAATEGKYSELGWQPHEFCYNSKACCSDIMYVDWDLVSKEDSLCVHASLII